MADIEPVPMQQRLMEYIRGKAARGQTSYSVVKLLGDASTRQYYRFVSETNQSFIIALYPEPFDPERFAYLQVYELFDAIGVKVPKIVDIDGPLGVVLQQDIGNESLQMRLRTAGSEETRTLLQQSVDNIGKIQREGTKRCRPDSEAAHLAFDVQKLGWELDFFLNNYVKRYRDRSLAPAAEQALRDEFGRMSEEIAAAPRYLCHRDYHCRNLMVHAGQIYVLDFQDARMGPCTYDLVSLLKDSIDLGAEMSHDLVDYFRKQNAAVCGSDRAGFVRLFHLTTIQRLLKALGTFGYQITTRELYIYEQYIRGALLRTAQSLQVLNQFPAIEELVSGEI